MNSFGRHTYYQAQDIKPGSLYLANRGDEVQLILGIQPVINGDNTGVLILKRISGSSFSSDFIAIPGERFAQQSQFMLVRDCILVPAGDVTQWKMTLDETAPVGAVYSRNGAMFISARNADGERLLVNCDSGEVVPPNFKRCFWTQGWEIKQQDEDGKWRSIL